MRLSQTSVDRIVSDLARAKLSDPRRTQRLKRVLAKVARQPSAPLPAALGSEAEVQGAYRLMNNPHVEFDALVKAHIQATKQRAEQARRVIVVHDTTECTFPHLMPAEIGFLPTGKAGFPLHLSLVIDGGQWRRPLGVSYAETLHRWSNRRRRRTCGRQSANQKNRQFERWWRGMEGSSEALRHCEEVIHVADRESDSYELMAKLLAAGQRFVLRVRADHRRAWSANEDGYRSTVREVVANCEGIVEREVPLSRRRKKSAPGSNRVHAPRKQRIAKLRFAATRILIPRPPYLREPLPQVLELNLVHVVEPDPPSEETPVEWLLYSTEPIGTPKEVSTVVDIYRTRWVIEEFNGALKTGCAYEARQFETRHALLTMLALSLPIACEILWLRSRARSSPLAPASEVLTPLQIRILRKLGSRRLSPHPTAQEALFAVAGIGGHQKGNGDPGWKILQRGMALLHSYELGWTACEASATASEF